MVYYKVKKGTKFISSNIELSKITTTTSRQYLFKRFVRRQKSAINGFIAIKITFGMTFETNPRAARFTCKICGKNNIKKRKLKNLKP